MKFKLKDIPKDLLKSIKEDCVWDIVEKGILEIENIPTVGDVAGGTYYPDFKKLMEYRINEIKKVKMVTITLSDSSIQYIKEVMEMGLDSHISAGEIPEECEEFHILEELVQSGLIKE